jgi:hypothetical protein
MNYCRVSSIKPGIILALFIVISTLSFGQSGGQGYFSSDINWSQTPALYYSVAGAPPFTCGDLVTTRNGSSLRASNWICTDGNGNATKGPWTWTNTPGDQTDRGAHIEWSNGTSTTSKDHIWDKTCPTLYLSATSGAPPTSFKGTATDGNWGAGFLSPGTSVTLEFYNATNMLWYDPSTNLYNHNFSAPTITATLTGLGIFTSPSYNMSWNASSVPAASTHTHGETYHWIATLHDGDSSCTAKVEYDFVYP